VIKLLEKIFTELVEQLAHVESTKQRKYSEHSGQYDEVDDEKFLSWRVKERDLLSRACGI